MSDPIALIQPGIYFGLTNEAYHNDQALGGTDVNLLARDPVEYQFRRLKPEAEETQALIRGQAQHARCLEGRRVFNEKFKLVPDKKDYEPPVLDTIEDLRDHALSIGLDKLPRRKDELVELIRTVDDDVVIWQEVMWRHDADPRIAIPKKTAQEIEQAADWLQADRLTGAVMKDGTFTGGAPEVSIFWEEDGIRLKCRFDYLLPHAVIDLKTFSYWRDQTVEAGAINAIVSYRYDINAAHYLRGWAAAKKMWADKDRSYVVMTLDGNITQQYAHNLLGEAFSNPQDEPLWVWVFLKTMGAPQPIVLEWGRVRSPMAFGAAEADVARALENYRKFSQEFGPDKPWPPRHNAVLLEDTSFPPWFGRMR